MSYFFRDTQYTSMTCQVFIGSESVKDCAILCIVKSLCLPLIQTSRCLVKSMSAIDIGLLVSAWTPTSVANLAVERHRLLISNLLLHFLLYLFWRVLCISNPIWFIACCRSFLNFSPPCNLLHGRYVCYFFVF